MAVNVVEYTKWVESIVRRYVRKDSPQYKDLIQESFVGLLEAARTFDESKGFTFLTYATPAIHQRIQRARRRAPTIHAPDVWDADKREALDIPQRSDRASQALQFEHDPHDEGVLQPLLRAAGMHTDATQEADLLRTERTAAARAALNALPPRDRRIVERVVLEGANYREVAAEVGVTFQRVHQIVEAGLETMRRQLVRTYETDELCA